MVTSKADLNWQPQPTVEAVQSERELDLDAAGLAPVRPLEPGVPYPWPWPLINQETTQTVLHVEQLR